MMSAVTSGLLELQLLNLQMEARHSLINILCEHFLKFLGEFISIHSFYSDLKQSVNCKVDTDVFFLQSEKQLHW